MIRESKQIQAVFWWHALPHLLLWALLFIQLFASGFHQYFNHIMPVMPLLLAWLWLWEWRDTRLALSLFFAGLFYDVMIGMPLGFHGALWPLAYLIAPYTTRHKDEDTAFVIRWLVCAAWLAAYLAAEALLVQFFSLNGSSLISILFRWLLMLLLLPMISWVIKGCKRHAYRKFWMFLPEATHIGRP